VRRVIRWLRHASGGPFLLYVHATDPHFPYGAPRRYAVDFLSPASMRLLPDATEAARPLHNGNQEWGTRPAPLTERQLDLLRDAYDSDVRMADESFGRLVDALAADGVLDHTIIVLTSDHGEEFEEHGGVAHGQTLYAETLDVPLLVRLPEAHAGGTVIDTLAQQVDILPTILDAAGVPAPPGLSGSPLFRARAGAIEAHASLRLAGRMIDAVVGDGWKVVRDGDRFEVYRTDRDPGEHADRSATETALLEHARAHLAELATPRLPGPRVPEERLERLRSLGYVDE
jgi:arylsulfatase A-like enzyme